MIKYKLTNQKMQTYKGFQWKLGEWQEAQGGSDKELCSNGWLHCYDSPLLAILHNPIHANIHNPRLFEVEVDGEFKDDKGIKCGYKKMRLVREIPVPKITTEQRIKYAILCVKQIYTGKKWNIWADNWLSNVDRTAATANAIAYATADAAAYDIVYDAANATAYVDVANAAVYDAAIAAAITAAAPSKKINLIELAEESMK